MRRCYRSRHGWLPLALALALQGGCQLHKPGIPGLRPSGGATSTSLSASQVADIYVGIGQSLEKRGESGQAITAYAEALEKDPKRVDAYIRLGVLADGLGKFPDALQWYRKALNLQPNNPNIYCDLGYSLYLQGQWAAAESNLRNALALAPDHQRAHNNLGLVLARAGRADEALVEFRKGGCSRAGAQGNLAFALSLKGSWPEAREHYELALKEDPSSVPARKGLQQVDALIAKAGSSGPQLARGGEPAPPARPGQDDKAGAAPPGLMFEDATGLATAAPN